MEVSLPPNSAKKRGQKPSNLVVFATNKEYLVINYFVKLVSSFYYHILLKTFVGQQLHIVLKKLI